MGVMRFIVHPPDHVESLESLQTAFVTGFDGRVFPTNSEVVDGVLNCRRSCSDSGKVSVPWQVKGFGQPVLTTTSLRERDEPYILVLELARGKLASIREQAAVWEAANMSIPDSFREIQSEAFRLFARASSRQNDLDECVRFSETAIEKSCEAAELLCQSYIIQRMNTIRRTSVHSPSLLGVVTDAHLLTPDTEPVFLETFTAASIPIRWVDIEPNEGQYNWKPLDDLVDRCVANRLITRGGPLINLGPNGLPEWLACWKLDFLNLSSFVYDFVDTAVSRYTGKIRIWEVSSAGNIGGALNLDEEQSLSLVARTLEAAIRTDSDSQFFIRIEQPWGEYQRHGRHRLSPYQFVDALIRSNIGLTGVSLDINCGYTSRGCLGHDSLSISRLIDIWSLLGLQIHVNLCCPSASTFDPLANPAIAVDDKMEREPWSQSMQAEWMDRVIPLLMAKSSVTGIFLRQLSDSVRHRFPHGGLFDADGQPKAMLETLRRQ